MSLRQSVLVYDDDADMRELVPRVLRKQYDVITQSRLQDVVAEVRHLKPDLILMDYYMHSSDSSEVIRTLKNDPATKDIPIILFSSHKHGDRLANELRVDGFLAKPFSLNGIRTCVADMLERMPVPLSQSR